jgi:hypothetical protein
MVVVEIKGKTIPPQNVFHIFSSWNHVKIFVSPSEIGLQEIVNPKYFFLVRASKVLKWRSAILSHEKHWDYGSCALLTIGKLTPSTSIPCLFQNAL